MTAPQPTFPFELTPDELENRLDEMVEAIWSTLQSNFLTLPKGAGFLPYERFASAYDVLHLATRGFREWSIDSVWAAFEQDPVVFIVVRTILGMQPPEWAYLTAQEGTEVSQNQARTLDRIVRESARRLTPLNLRLIRAMLVTAVRLLSRRIPATPPSAIHRLDKHDTSEGLVPRQGLRGEGVRPCQQIPGRESRRGDRLHRRRNGA